MNVFIFDVVFFKLFDFCLYVVNFIVQLFDFIVDFVDILEKCEIFVFLLDEICDYEVNIVFVGCFVNLLEGFF